MHIEVKWFKIIYDDFAKFTKYQERLISVDGFDYVEGSLILKNSHVDSFFSPSNESIISSLTSKKRDFLLLRSSQELQVIFKVVNINSGLIFTKDATISDFLNRVRDEEVLLQSLGLGLWEVPHLWLNLFVPRSTISDFNQGFLVDIISKESLTTGPFLIYPINRKGWDARMSVAIPEEEDDDMFYTVALLNSAGPAVDPSVIDKQNNRILEFCDKARIYIK
ncbi:putative cytokinin dehydrogenase [Helianthus anomalus]